MSERMNDFAEMVANNVVIQMTKTPVYQAAYKVAYEIAKAVPDANTKDKDNDLYRLAFKLGMERAKIEQKEIDNEHLRQQLN